MGWRLWRNNIGDRKREKRPRDIASDKTTGGMSCSFSDNNLQGEGQSTTYSGAVRRTNYMQAELLADLW